MGVKVRVQVRATWLLAAALGLGVLAVLAAAARNGAAHRGTQATRALEAGAPAEALELATAALAWYPYDVGAQFSQLVALKRLGMWPALEAGTRRVLAWHPDAAPLLQLAGEAAWREGRDREAAAALWDSLWRAPTPPQTPAQFWRVALAAGRKLWDARDPRLAAAAVRVLTLLDQDVTMKDPAKRKQAVDEAAQALRAAGAPLTAEIAK